MIKDHFLSIKMTSFLNGNAGFFHTKAKNPCIWMLREGRKRKGNRGKKWLYFPAALVSKERQTQISVSFYTLVLQQLLNNQKDEKKYLKMVSREIQKQNSN